MDAVQMEAGLKTRVVQIAWTSKVGPFVGFQAFNELAFVTSEQTAGDVSGQIIATSHDR